MYNKKPKVSVIVPIYNVEKYLQRCMDSLLNQTLKNIEIILVDDESPDNCPAICDDYARKDDRVKVIHKKNEGLGLARNSGLEISTGEYIAFIDSDDFIDLNSFENLYNEAGGNDLDVVFSNFYLESKSKCFDKVSEIKEREILETAEQIQNFLFDMIGLPPIYPMDRLYSMSVWHAIYSNDLIKRYNIHFVSERLFLSEDVLFHIDFLSKAKKIGLLPFASYYYCLNDTSLTNTFRSDRFQKYILLHKELEHRMVGLFPSEEKKWKNSIDRLFLSYTRHALIKPSISNGNSYRSNIRLIKEVCSEPYFQSILQRYPYAGMSAKHRFFMLIMYLKMYNVIYLFKFLRSIT